MTLLPRYYQTELAYYRDLLRELAAQHPDLAHIVLEGADEAVERLIQGASLFTARLRYRNEDDFPGVICPLFEQPWPQYLRPVPAATLLQLAPRHNALTQSQAIASGTCVTGKAPKTESGAAVAVPFRTSSTVVLHPLEIVTATLDQPHPAELQLRLGFEITGRASFSTLDLRALRLHFVGEAITCCTLLLWLAHRARAVSLRDANGKSCLTLGAESIRPIGFVTDEALCPGRSTPLDGLRLLHEYFGFREKFFGVEIAGLDRTPLDAIEQTFELVFHLGQVSREGVTVNVSDFALACTPAINVSEEADVEIKTAPGVSEYLLEAPDGGEVFDVHRVGGYHKERREWVDYQPFFQDVAPHDSRAQLCYQLLRRGDGIHGGQSYLVITDSSGRLMEPPTERLRARMTHTHADLPLRLGVGDVCMSTFSTPDFVVARNLTPIVPPEPLAIGRDQHWELLSFFTMHMQDLASTNGLTQLLQRGRGHRATVGGQPEILDVRSRTGHCLHRKAVVATREIEVDVEERSFSCEGHLFLFGLVLQGLYSAKGPVPMLVSLTLRAMPSGLEHRFPPELSSENA